MTALISGQLIPELDLDAGRLQWPLRVTNLSAIACLSFAAFVTAQEKNAPTEHTSVSAPRRPAFVQAGTLAAPEANQAVAVDDRFVYAVDSALIAKYDRATGQRV